MEKSLFFQYTEKYFPGVVAEVVEMINGKRQGTPLLFPTLLNTTYSVDGRWASIKAQYNRVAADVVALSSELPVKQRASLSTGNGELPKLGMKLALTEKQMKDLDMMIATARNQNDIARIIRVIFEDTPQVINGIYDRIEDMFLSGLSTGCALSANNDGTGARITYGYEADKQFGVSKAITDPDCPILTELQEKVFDKAIEDGNTITDLWLDDYALKGLYNNKEMKNQYAFNLNFAGANVPVLQLDQVNDIFQRRWGVTLHRVATVIKTEKNGVQVAHKPWQEGMMVFTCNATLGDLVWTNVAEDTRRVAGVQYETANEFILVSKYSTNDPLQEFTASQAMVAPILSNVDQIYTVDTKKVTA